jgi:predicted ArsR family transcriptional regulator
MKLSHQTTVADLVASKTFATLDAMELRVYLCALAACGPKRRGPLTSASIGVTPVTARRVLAKLEQLGLIRITLEAEGGRGRLRKVVEIR